MDDSQQHEIDEQQLYSSDEEIGFHQQVMNNYPGNFLEALVQQSQNLKNNFKEVKVEREKVNQIPLKEYDMNEENSVCKICYKHAINAVLCNNEKCSILMCGKCLEETVRKNDNKCPFCRTGPFEPKMSPYQEAINKMEWKCSLCIKSYILEEEQKHYRNECGYFHKIQCRYCPERLSKDQAVKHTREKHSDKFDQIIQEMYRFPSATYDPRELVSKKKEYLSKIHKSPKLGTTGKFYCGSKLDPPKCSCCNGYCGPTNGQNCSECMKLDILRFRLPKGYLVNSNGQICWKVGNSFVCNTMNYYQDTICKEDNPCRPCYNMTKNIVRYSDLL